MDTTRILFFGVSVALCVAASWFFTLAGTRFADLGIVPLLELSSFQWGIWGMTWGAICGILGARVMLAKVIKKRDTFYGTKYGIITGFSIGSVNGLLTNTLIYGILEGVFLGALCGFLVSNAFLAVYKDS